MRRRWNRLSTLYWCEMQWNRRDFLMSAIAAPLLAATKKAQPVQRPNIVLIATEEWGAYMVGCYGNPDVRTPNIDRLAQTGVRFTNCFSCLPVAPDQTAYTAAGFNCGRTGTEAATATFLDAQTPAKPFFLVIEWPSPNTLEAPKKILDLYAATDFEKTAYDNPAPNATRKDMLRNIPGNLRKYAAALTVLDSQIPALQAKLQQRGVLENTLIIFTSGSGYLLGRHGLWGGPAASDPPNLYDELVRTPLIWTWPSTFPPQTVRNDVVASYDLMPAIGELTGVAPPPVSYLPYVYGHRLGKKQSWLGVAFCRAGDLEMARDDRYKLILRAQGKSPGELYDETTDPREQTNQYDSPKYENMRQKLTAQIAAWRGNRPA